MATVSIRKAKQSLLEKGFFEDEEKAHEKSHWYYRLYVNGEPTEIVTHISRRPDGDDIWQNEIRGMKLQLSFNSTNALLDFLRCTMRHDRYLEILTEQGVLEAEDGSGSKSVVGFSAG